MKGASFERKPFKILTDRLICNMTFSDQVNHIDTRSNFENDLLRSNHSSFDESQKEKHDVGKMNAESWLSQKLLHNNLFRTKLQFLEFLHCGGQTVDLRSNLRTFQRKSVKRADECAFSGRCSSSGSRVMGRFVEQC